LTIVCQARKPAGVVSGGLFSCLWRHPEHRFHATSGAFSWQPSRCRSKLGIISASFQASTVKPSQFSRREVVTAIAASLASATALPLFLPLGQAFAQAQPEASASTADKRVQKLLGQCAEHLLTNFPEFATSLGLDKGSRAGLRSQLGDRSMDGRSRLAGQLSTDLDTLNRVDASSLSAKMATNLAVVKSAYSTALEGMALPYGDATVGSWRNTPYVVIQNVGAYLDTPRFLDSDHLINNADDAEAYLARMESYALQLDGELDRIQAAHELGLVPPAFLLDKAISQMTLSIEGARKGGPVVDSLTRRTKDIPGDWAARASSISTQSIAPALERQLAELQEQRKIATNEAGMSARPHGDEFYRWALKASTTTNMTPDEIHETGRSELKDLHARMDAILKEIGYTTGSVGARMTALAKDPKYQFADGDPGRAEIMDFIQQQLTWIKAQMPRAFNTLVDPYMEVKRLPPEEEPGAPGAYGGAGSLDGTIPGRFWINLHTTKLHSKYSLADLTFHEAIPGHIWQGEFANDQPLVRAMLSFNAYSEGWGLYAEQLADELGAYDKDVVGRLGYLQSLAFRACRLVIDTGLHAKGWTREQGRQFFIEKNGTNPLEAASEVDRYCSWPGQACGYKIGHTEINRLRTHAQTALGDRYDLRAFNDTLLLGGNVPLDVLGQNVEAYIQFSG
jgi:uncharacterized protein (DUF885 family)